MKEKAKADDGEMTIPDLCKSDKFAGCAPLVCTPFDRTGSLVALSTEAKKFSCGEKRTGCSVLLMIRSGDQKVYQAV
jgi:hypothetical protein